MVDLNPVPLWLKILFPAVMLIYAGLNLRDVWVDRVHLSVKLFVTVIWVTLMGILLILVMAWP